MRTLFLMLVLMLLAHPYTTFPIGMANRELMSLDDMINYLYVKKSLEQSQFERQRTSRKSGLKHDLRKSNSCWLNSMALFFIC